MESLTRVHGDSSSRDIFVRLFKTHECISQQLMNSPILSFHQESISIMVNKGQINGEIGYFQGVLKI